MRTSAPIIIDRTASNLTVNDLPEPDFCEYHHVGVFEGEPVKDDQTVVVHIDAVQDALFLCQVGTGERE